MWIKLRIFHPDQKDREKNILFQVSCDFIIFLFHVFPQERCLFLKINTPALHICAAATPQSVCCIILTTEADLARYWLSGDHLRPQTSCLWPTSRLSGAVLGVLMSRCRISLSLLPLDNMSPFQASAPTLNHYHCKLTTYAKKIGEIVLLCFGVSASLLATAVFFNPFKQGNMP